MITTTHPILFPRNRRPQARSISPGSSLLLDALEQGMVRLQATEAHTRATRGDVDVAGYSALLAGLWTAYAGIEQRLIAFAPAPVLEVLPQLRASLLLEDVATLRQPGVLRSVMKSTAHPPAIHSSAAAIGAVHAMEYIDGAAGAMLATLRNDAGLPRAHAFFQWCADQHARRWPLAQRITGEAMASSTTDVVDGVHAAFDALVGRLSPVAQSTRSSRSVRERSREVLAA